MTKKQKIKLLLDYIISLWYQNKIELNYKTPFQLLVAVMLSAQATDIQVNKITQYLFKQIKNPVDIKKMWLDNFREKIKSINYFNNKSKYVYQTSLILLEKYNSKVPDVLDEIITLPWVWIKTAKVVLNQLYGQNYIWVDTHVHRVLNRFGIVNTKNPEQTDKKIEEIFTKEQKKQSHHWLVLFGRYICKAKKPKCSECKLKNNCKFYNLLKKDN